MSEVQEGTIKHKLHRDRNAGRKADKKKSKNEHVQELTDKQKNPKAFTFNSAIRAERRFRRKQDIDTKKQHIPLVDRTPLEPPPVLVAIVGPPKVGKSMLIQCLIKSFTRQPLSNIVGPVTVVSGKKRRITFMECNNDINSMIDIAKVADLVLLLVDASFGFEMEIFEFLNICQVHGMPRIMGVLTHLDCIKNAKQLRKIKKTLKHRFWTEVYAGAKLFYLSGLLHDEYLRNEVKNLARFISVIKFRPLTWRTTHPYLLADRIEDLTPPESMRQNPKVDRTISLYGYVRGVPLNKESSVHIPGCGDLRIKDVSFLADPCPLPEQLKKRSLVEKERLIYAPFSGVGGIVYDKDAVYVELGGSHSHHEKEGQNTELVNSLMDTQETIDKKLRHSEMQIFSGAEPIKSEDVRDNINTSLKNEAIIGENWIRRKVIFNDEREEELEGIGDNDDKKGDDGIVESDMDESDLESDTSKASKRKLPQENKTSNKKQRTASATLLDTTEESEDDESTESNDSKTVNTSGKSRDKTEDEHLYRGLSNNPDSHIKDKISEALNLISKHKPKKLEHNESETDLSENESFDDESEDDFELHAKDDNFLNEVKEEDDDDDDAEEEEDKEDKEEENELQWKSNLTEKASTAFTNRKKSRANIMKIVYGTFDKSLAEENEVASENENEEQDIGGIFHIVRKQQTKKIEERELRNQEESVFYSKELTHDWLLDDNKPLLINRFVTGKWKGSEDAAELLKLDDLEDNEELYGDFEDLETGEKHQSDAPKEMTTNEAEERRNLIEKKRKLKEKFDSEYDKGDDKSYYDELKSEVDRQAQLNKSEFEGIADDVRVQLEGYRPGMYIRVELDSVPCELLTNLDPTYPLIVGGLLHGEENIGFVQTRIKKHRWHKKILKTKDPLIISVGWRRFQTIPVYSKLEDDLKNRMLKYTPEHVTCMAHFWGPITPQGTGVLAVQDVVARQAGFRIAATGSIVELDKSTCIVKKLKLTGVPLKVYKKTAFIKGMFNSSLEVAKFEGAKLRTVSGIRGQIKKASSKPEGSFRATFEDKILLSDIVFCRTWYKVDVPRFYSPVTSLLLPPNKKNQWRGMKTTGQLKRENSLKAQANLDSLYTPIEREPKVFKPLIIPRTLQKVLPYKDKPKLPQVPGKLKPKLEDQRVAVIREPKEEKIAKLMRMLRTSYSHKQEQLKESMNKRITAHQARMEIEEARKMGRQRELKKQVFRKLSKAEAKNKNKKR
ncbi:ribosome biogenesis protein BMS1 homolog [Athalia rosae]|uniref:ribosome biogenesis protein BMS1 homolog n=1 Tax=Athalia rosae TaxID=37344 RepID=UPI00203448F9|nr:ribosome biogenesis protein BMS1 homolog [Athalia rosae]